MIFRRVVLEPRVCTPTNDFLVHDKRNRELTNPSILLCGWWVMVQSLCQTHYRSDFLNMIEDGIYRPSGGRAVVHSPGMNLTWNPTKQPSRKQIRARLRLNLCERTKFKWKIEGIHKFIKYGELFISFFFSSLGEHFVRISVKIDVTNVSRFINAQYNVILCRFLSLVCELCIVRLIVRLKLGWHTYKGPVC